jgi:hypothetical protein
MSQCVSVIASVPVTTGDFKVLDNSKCQNNTWVSEILLQLPT